MAARDPRLVELATQAQMATLVDMGADMVAEAPEYQDSVYSRSKARAAIDHCISQGSAFMVRTMPTKRILGMAFVDLHEHWILDEISAVDLGIYVQPGSRGTGIVIRLVEAMEIWARDHGAKYLTLGISTGVHVELTAKVYRRLGYEDCGIALRRRL